MDKMEFKGIFTGAGIDFTTGKFIMSLRADDNVTAAYEKLKDRELTVVIKPYRKKRSLDANAYMWVLLQEIADVLSTPKNRIDKWDVYLDMLSNYGVFTHLIVKPHVVERMKQEWRAVRVLGEVTVNGSTGIQLQCYFGSSTYNTAEMSRLIDGVVTECRQLEIETLTPSELAQMKAEWGRK